MSIFNFELPLWLAFVSCAAIALFFFADEEPALDPTDWNLTHVVLLVLSAMVVCWDNIVRSRFGQFVYKDQILMFSAFAFWFGIDWWSRLIILVFFFHCLVALEADLFETSEPFLGLLSWATCHLLAFFIIFYIVYGLLFWVNSSLKWCTLRAVTISSVLATVLLGVFALVLTLDLVLNSFSGCDLRDSSSRTYYNHPRTALSYDYLLADSDTFDWHITRNRPVTVHLEELASFYAALLSVVNLIFAFLFLINFTIDVTLKLNMQPYAEFAQPFVFLGVVLRWLDHAVIVALISPCSIFIISIRLWLRVNFFFAM